MGKGAYVSLPIVILQETFQMALNHTGRTLATVVGFMPVEKDSLNKKLLFTVDYIINQLLQTGAGFVIRKLR